MSDCRLVGNGRQLAFSVGVVARPWPMLKTRRCCRPSRSARSAHSPPRPQSRVGVLEAVFRAVNAETSSTSAPLEAALLRGSTTRRASSSCCSRLADGDWHVRPSAASRSPARQLDQPRYFEKREMRPLFVEELPVHPDYQGAASAASCSSSCTTWRGCAAARTSCSRSPRTTSGRSTWYRRRSFYKLDAAIFLAQEGCTRSDELLPPRKLPTRRKRSEETASLAGAATPRRRARRKKPDGAPPTS